METCEEDIGAYLGTSFHPSAGPLRHNIRGLDAKRNLIFCRSNKNSHKSKTKYNHDNYSHWKEVEFKGYIRRLRKKITVTCHETFGLTLRFVTASAK